MTKQSNKKAYPNQSPISDNDYLGGTNGDTIKKETKSFQLSDLRDYLLSGLSPIVGGTLKITEIVYNGILTLPQEVANQLNPSKIVLPYEIVIFNVNGDKYQLKKQDITIGILQTPILGTDFIPISLIASNLSNSISTYKGYNLSTGREEHYSIGSVGFSITKEMSGLNETGRILLEQTSQTNLGTGVPFYKGINNTTKLQEFYTFSSPDHNISLVGNEVVISNPASSEINQLIVNSDYTGSVELGTITKPFKNTQNALNAYKGTGTNLAPQLIGNRILVQKDTNEFTGTFLYKGLNIVISSGRFTSNPSSGQYLLDMDSDAVLPSGILPYSDSTIDNISITIEEGAEIFLKKQGFKNRGTTFNDNLSKGKSIYFFGKGQIAIDSESSISSSSVRRIIVCNDTNLTGYFNGGNVGHFYINCSLYSNNSAMIHAGLNGVVLLESGSNSRFLFSNNTSAQSNSNTIPIYADNAQIRFRNVEFQIYGYQGANFINRAFVLNNCNLQLDECIIIGQINNLFENLNTTQSTLRINKCNFIIQIVNEIFKSSSIVWNNAKVQFSSILSGNLSTSNVLLAGDTINNIKGRLVETLSEYPSKYSAQLGGLLMGSAFINRKVVTTGNFIVGEEYKISNIGNTNFTLIGATANTIGLYFTAINSGNGTTGTADLIKRDILI